MFYLGYFSFDELGFEDEERHGYFNCMVEADSPDTALERFKNHIMDMKTDDPLFGRIVKIYVEDLVEVKNIPDKPVVTRFQSSTGHFPKSISMSLPSVKSDDFASFRWAKDGMESGAGDTEEEYMTSEPFIHFDENA